jgi:hypothetical protein
MCKQTLNTLIIIEVIWSTEPTWNMCIIGYFLSVINLNKQRSNETLVSAAIWSSDLPDRRRACYQLSHAASLQFRLIVGQINCCNEITITSEIIITTFNLILALKSAFDLEDQKNLLYLACHVQAAQFLEYRVHSLTLFKMCIKFNNFQFFYQSQINFNSKAELVNALSFV